MKLFLIRHAESMQNTKLNNELEFPDPLVYLTERGKKQANEAGLFLSNYLKNNNINLDNAKLWISPFRRTRDTANIINKYLNISVVNEDITLVEQQYGLFSDKSIEQIKKLYPNEFKYYDNYYQTGNKFYAKLPQGESPFDVAIRTRMFLESIEKEQNDPVFIISHGTTIRMIVLNIFHYSPEWFSKEPNMENCSIRLIEQNTDKYIYGGPIKRLKK